MNVFYESLSIRKSMVLKDKDVIREVNGFYLTLIMNYLWRIDLHTISISNGHFTVEKQFISIISRVQFQVYSRVTIEINRIN